MPAKYLQTMGEERRPEMLHRQMGCVTGILQAFDRRYPLAGAHNSHKRLLPPGNALSINPGVGEERTRYRPQIVFDKNLSESWIENQTMSSTVDLSQASYSSSSCSSFSSLDGNRSTQQDLSSTDRMLFPEKPLKCSPKLKSSPDSESGTDYYPDDTLTKSPDMRSAQSSRPNFGIRNLVKDSIYKDTRDLRFVRTVTREVVEDHTFDYGDPPACLDELPRPSSGIQGKSKGTMDINESLRVLAKLREFSRNNPCESGQQPRLSYDAHRFSYDGRESASRLKEIPRLSLDIKEGPLRTSEMDLRLKPSMTSAEINTGSNKEQAAGKRLPSVVAKLMGLEELPERKDNTMMPSQVSRSVHESMLTPLNFSSHDEPTPPRQQRNLDVTVRNVANSKFPVETAPWKQQERIVLPRKLPKGPKEAHGKEQQPAASVYSEIEKRLKDLDFQQSNKDLRALKQIIDSMQAKGLLQNKKHEEASMLNLYDDNHDSREVTDANLRLNDNTNPNQMPQIAPSCSMEEDSNAERFLKSPIVIMKPAKSTELLSDADSPIIPMGGLSDLPHPRTGDSTAKKKSLQINRSAIEQHPKSSPRVPASQPLASDRKANGRNQAINKKQKSGSQLMTESSLRRQQLPRDNNGSLLKHKNSMSPRSPQKKLDAEQRSRPPIHPLESKNQRQSAVDTVSPRSRCRRKPDKSEDGRQNGGKSRTRSQNQHGDDMSTRSDGSMSVASDLDIEVTSADRSAEVYSSQQGNQTPSGKNPQKVRTSYDANKDLASKDPASNIPERPSPVSVLDYSSFDQENFFRKKAPNSPNVDDEHHPSEEFGKPTKPKNSKLANVASLLQKLQQLSMNKDDDDDDEAPPVDHIAFLCGTQSPDHRYMSEILLASGLLMKDLGSGLSQIQLHGSGYPINPDLFLVLERRRSGWMISKPESIHVSRRCDDPKRSHRKLMFDTINQLLLDKFEKETSVHSGSSLSAITSSGQQLVKTICSEMELLKTERSSRWMFQEDSSGSSSVIPDAEILHRLEGWTTSSFDRLELPAMVLEIEKSIFKELVDEVVRADGRMQAKVGRRRLFAPAVH